MTNEKSQSGGLAPLPADLTCHLPLRDLYWAALGLIDNYQKTRSAENLLAILDLGRQMIWITGPMATKAYGPTAGLIVGRWSEQLLDWGRPWANPEFPTASDNSDLILDSLENLRLRLDRVLDGRKRRKASQSERRAA